MLEKGIALFPKEIINSETLFKYCSINHIENLEFLI